MFRIREGVDDEETIAEKEKKENQMRRFLVAERGKYGRKVEIALGCLAPGVYNEPLLTLDALDRDLKFAQDAGFDTATIFRVGGLNEDYMKVIRKYVG